MTEPPRHSGHQLNRDDLARPFPWLADLNDEDFAQFRAGSLAASSRDYTRAHLDLKDSHPVVIGDRDSIYFLIYATPDKLHQRWHEQNGTLVPKDLVRDDPRLTRLVQSMADDLVDFSLGERGCVRLGDHLTTVMRPSGQHVCVISDRREETLIAAPGPITHVTNQGTRTLSTPPGSPLERIPWCRDPPSEWAWDR